MASHNPNSREDTRFRVLRLLEENPELSQRELAEGLGISIGSTHYLIRALIDMGFIKLGNFTSAKDKRRYAYILTPRGVREKAAITKRFLTRKLAEYEALKQEIAGLKDLADMDSSSAQDKCSAPNADDYGRNRA